MTDDLWVDILSGVARPNGAYAVQKLTFFDRYLSPAFQATRRKLTRHYLDLFAGPGVWEDPTGQRRIGSPLKALTLSGAVPYGEGFTEVFLVNQDETDHAELDRRVDLLVERGLTNLPRSKIHCVQGDANVEVLDILDRIHSKSWIFTYADIENPSQWPWATVEALRSKGHESMDLYMLFPLHMALHRILGFTKSHPDAVTRFYGCEDWRPIAEKRVTSAHSRTFLREMESLYAARLRQVGWTMTRRQRRVAASGERYLYYMLFATSNPVADVLSEWEAVEGGDERHRDQLGLGL